ncbi:MAG: hypothetical protein ACJ76L_09860 [Conexibacter sp.]
MAANGGLGMRTWVGWAVAVGSAVIAAAPAAAGAAQCSDADAAISVQAPSYVNAGKSIPLTVEHFAATDAVTGFTATIGGVSTPIASQALGTMTLGVTAPAALGRTQLTIAWEQAAGAVADGAPACSGRLDLQLTVVRPSVRIGDTDAPRIDGVWKLVATPLDWDARTVTMRWTPTPRCDIGACAILGDIPGLVYTPEDAQRYRGTRSPVLPTATCRIEERQGGRLISRRYIHNAFLLRQETTLRVTASRRLPSGLLQATRIEGIDRSTYTPTGEARAHHCRGAIVNRTRVVAFRR